MHGVGASVVNASYIGKGIGAVSADIFCEKNFFVEDNSGFRSRENPGFIAEIQLHECENVVMLYLKTKGGVPKC